MRVAIFSSRPYEVPFLEEANAGAEHDLHFFEARLTLETAALANGFTGVSVFVNDQATRDVLRALAAGGTRLLALRSAGFNHVDLAAAAELSITVVRVPAYSPYAVAEHAAALILSLNRKLHRAYARVREMNFALDGLLGFDLHGKTIGVFGTGRIGTVFCRIMLGFGCRVIANDPYPSDECTAMGVRYVDRETLFTQSDIVAMHCPLTPETHHMLDEAAFARMKPGAMVINTSRGALIDTRAAIGALKSGRIGQLGLDVYEEEAHLFFEDLSDQVIQDDVFARLLTFPNVLITGHQGFFTREALVRIAETTIGNVTAFERGAGELHEVTLEQMV
jgi:D-lactate dehydrogenase